MNIKGLFKQHSRKENSLILHIGMPKTGTTAIQGFLAHNRNKLIHQKILYPECGVPVNQHTALVKSIAAPLFDWVRFNNAIEQFDADDYVKDISRQCKSAGCKKIILSSEFFWASPPMQAGPLHHIPNEKNFNYIYSFIKQCRKIFSVFDTIKIVVYLRRQDEWFDSFFNQQLKDGFPIPSENELLNGTKNYLLYHANLTIWAEHFGKENLVVRNYDDLPGRDVVKDFLNISGIKIKSLSQPEKTQDLVNAKLSKKSAAIMKQAIDMGLDADVQSLLRKVLQGLSHDTIPVNQKSEYTLFSPDFYSSVLSLYNDDNIRLSREYSDLNLMSGLQTPANQKMRNDKEKINSKEDNIEDLIKMLLLEIERAKTND